ncbi:hypothetical protein IVB30_40995 [Bradyrhizobium sp. 200]|nr:hypothetical protein IVB30_40995 [Bradyrhizobium sp. 200]
MKARFESRCRPRSLSCASIDSSAGSPANIRDVDVEVLLLDGPLNPAAEGHDIAITAFPTTFDGVADEILWPLRRSLVASPSYLAKHAPLKHPRELASHRCVVYQPTGASWPFLGKTGVTSVTARPRLSSNNTLILLDAIKRGMGIGLLSNCVIGQNGLRLLNFTIIPLDLYASRAFARTIAL